MKCKICEREHHYCHNCGYDEDLAPFANGYCGWEHFIEGYDNLQAERDALVLRLAEIPTIIAYYETQGSQGYIHPRVKQSLIELATRKVP